MIPQKTNVHVIQRTRSIRKNGFAQKIKGSRSASFYQFLFISFFVLHFFIGFNLLSRFLFAAFVVWFAGWGAVVFKTFYFSVSFSSSVFISYVGGVLQGATGNQHCLSYWLLCCIGRGRARDFLITFYYFSFLYIFFLDSCLSAEVPQ